MPTPRSKLVENARLARLAKQKRKATPRAKSGNGGAGSATATKARPSRSREIVATTSYPVDLFLEITGLSPGALRMCQRDGLRVVRRGCRRFVLGEEWIRFLREVSKADAGHDAEHEQEATSTR